MMALVCCLWLLLSDTTAQTIHFSQAYMSHLTLNAANTGRFDGDWRVGVMHRQQGFEMRNDYSTSYLSFEYPVYIKNQKLNTGFYYSHDNSSYGSFPSERIYLSVAKGVLLSHRSQLNVGIQGGYVYKHLNSSGLTFPDQYSRDLGGFDGELPTSEMFEKMSTSYIDLTAGIVYQYQLKQGVVSLGYSMHQLNRPEESFYGLHRVIPLKYVVHSKGDFNIGTDFFVIPSVIFIHQSPADETLIGMNLGYNLNHWLTVKNNVIGGIHLRNIHDQSAGSVILSGGFTWQYWSVMASYDTNTWLNSQNRPYGQSFEIGVMYKLPSTEITQKTIPCERY